MASAFPLGWPPRPASGVRSIRFSQVGGATSNYSDCAYLFSQSPEVAYTSIGGKDVDGVVFIFVDATGSQGNDYSIEVQIPSGGPSALSAAFDTADTKKIIVQLAKNAGGDLNTAANTATLVAAAVDALANITASANGTGNTSLTRPERQKYFFGGGNVVQPSPNINYGSRVQTSVGTNQAGGSPMGGGTGSDPLNPYGPTIPMVWANTIIVSNDDEDATNLLEISFDGINSHGIVKGGETLYFRNRYEAGIAVRGVDGSTPAFRIHAW